MYLHNIIFHKEKHIDILILEKENNYYIKYSNLFIILNKNLLIEKIKPYKEQIINLFNFKIVNNLNIIKDIKDIIKELPEVYNDIQKNIIVSLDYKNDYDKFIYEKILKTKKEENKMDIKHHIQLE